MKKKSSSESHGKRVPGKTGQKRPTTRLRKASSAAPSAQRLHKLLAAAGLGSLRHMEELIRAGRITVNGKRVEIGAQASPGDMIRIDQRIVRLRTEERSPRVLIYHKPAGEIVSRDDPQGRPTVFKQLPALRSAKWVAVGRLDYNTEGLLILTTSGTLANRLMHPRFGLEREYAVRVMGEITREQARQLTTSIPLKDGPARFESLAEEGGAGSNRWYRIVLKEGRNREVRRMFEALGLMVSRLIRVRYASISLPPRLKRGQWLELKDTEVKSLTDSLGAGS